MGSRRRAILTSDDLEPFRTDNHNTRQRVPRLPSYTPEPDGFSDEDATMDHLPSSEDFPLAQLYLQSVASAQQSHLEPTPLMQNQVTSRQRPRRSSCPPMPQTPSKAQVNATSSDGIFSPETERRVLEKLRAQKRQETIKRKKEIQKDLLAQQEEAAILTRKDLFDRALADIHQAGYTLAQLLEYVFDPSTTLSEDYRWRGFFLDKARVLRILDMWASSSNSDSARATIHSWALQVVQQLVRKEAASVTGSGLLRTMDKTVDEDFFMSYSLSGITETLARLAPDMFAICGAFSTSTRQEREMSQDGFQRKRLLQGSALTILLKGFSRANNYPSMVNGTYLMATGAQRQHFSVLSSLGVSAGYSSIITPGEFKTLDKEEMKGKSDDEASETEVVAVSTNLAQDATGPTTTHNSEPNNGASREQSNGEANSRQSTELENLQLPVSENVDAELEASEAQTPRTMDASTTRAEQAPPTPKAPRAGMLRQLSDACRGSARSVAQDGRFGKTYDNVNLNIQVAEQILGRKNTQENGTCATVFPLFEANLDDMLTEDIENGIKNSPPLSIDAICLSLSEHSFLEECMIHTILRIIVTHGGSGFDHFKQDLKSSRPESDDKIHVHKTSIYPLPAMEIDEASVTGNIEVLEAIYTELDLNIHSAEFTKHAKIVAGDQLTIARQRSIVNIRIGHETGAESWKHVALMPGLFHAKIADCHGVLETHFGKPNAGTRSPGGLSFHNTVLDRIPIVLTSLPPFRTCRDLIMISLYARILHCLLLVSEQPSLEDCAASFDNWETLVRAARLVYERYADADFVQELREKRVPEECVREAARKETHKSKASSASHADTQNVDSVSRIASDEPHSSTSDEDQHVKKGDMVYENALLFIRDALLTREFTDSIKTGDSGRVIVILKLWTFAYRGHGRTKYAYEMLHLIHNLTNIWPTRFRDIIIKNWLLNLSGKDDGWAEADLIQEHLNFWIKRIYKADGNAHSWDWLATVSPCIDILRRLATSIHADLGAQQGLKHTTPELQRDIHRLMQSLEDLEVYTYKEGRVFDADEKPAPDAIAVGFAALSSGSSSSPLADFSAECERARARRHLTPISDLLQLLPNAEPAPEINPETSVNALLQAIQESQDLRAQEDSRASVRSPPIAMQAVPLAAIEPVLAVQALSDAAADVDARTFPYVNMSSIIDHTYSHSAVASVAAHTTVHIAPHATSFSAPESPVLYATAPALPQHAVPVTSPITLLPALVPNALYVASYTDELVAGPIDTSTLPVVDDMSDSESWEEVGGSAGDSNSDEDSEQEGDGTDDERDQTLLRIDERDVALDMDLLEQTQIESDDEWGAVDSRAAVEQGIEDAGAGWMTE